MTRFKCQSFALVLFALTLGPARAQAPQTQIGPHPSQDAVGRGAAIPVLIDAGTGRVLHLAIPATTVIAADPRIARVQPLAPNTLFIMGVANGRTTLVASGENGAVVAQYDVTVRGVRAADPPATETASGAQPAAAALNLAALSAAIRLAVPDGSAISVGDAPNGVRVSGTVRSPADAARIVSVLRLFAGDKADIVNDLIVLGSIQVNVRVRMAEISRQITRDLGFNWQAIGTSGKFVVGLTNGSSAGSAANALANAAGGTRVAAGINNKGLDLNAVVDALASDQLITILAEPNLTAQSGETASFLAGGEFPIPIGASSVNNQITIAFKQFGVSLSFTPTVLSDDRINLRVRPEVSELSSNGAISLPISGGVITVPALNVRRAETTVEVGSGQSFAIAGLLQRSTTQIDNGVIGLSDIPVLGGLFRSDAFKRNETELVIIVTPYLVKPVSGQPALPTDGFRPATDLDRLLYQRQIARGLSPTVHAPLDAGFILD